MADIHYMTGKVLEWIRPMIPDEQRDPMHTCIKLTEEVSELMHSIHAKEGDIGGECADVLILLLDIAHLNGVDLSKEFYAKMAVNRQRAWSKKNGALKHE
jgi:NTP pyrophosphatase (non-canonical NTP hydrolase)